MIQTIVLTVDYHDENCVIRRLNLKTTEERVLSVPTKPSELLRVVAQARAEVGRKGRVVWIQESTTGWARVKTLLSDQVDFQLANVVQMPLPPKGRRRKTDKIDTERIQREYLNGKLPRAHQPSVWWQQTRRLVTHRESLVARQTALRNWINRYLAHETWHERANLWTGKGRERLQTIVAALPTRDALVIRAKLDELDHLQTLQDAVLAELKQVYEECPDAQRLDAVRGIGYVAAVSIVARIGLVQRFKNAEQLIAYAGLAPGLQESDRTRRDGKIGGGGTDKHLRHYLIEATVWARQIPRYRVTYERVAKRRGNKIGRIVVARMLLRGIYKVLRDGLAFDPGEEAKAAAAKEN
jgi:transposase